MKQKTITIIILVITALTINVQAANYQLKELIPLNTETTIVTDNFSYKGLEYNNKSNDNPEITFKGIKNLTTENIPISISIGLFDKNKENIGIINYCSTSDQKSFLKDLGLDSKKEVSYSIPITANVLATNKKNTDIKYIAILSDNINCRINGSKDYIGKKVEDIGVIKDNSLDSNTKMLIKLVEIVAAIVVLTFLYKFLFTNAFRNFDGEDVRREYTYINKQLEEARKRNPKPRTKPKKTDAKSTKIKEQELLEGQKQNKEESDLHNFYK